MKREYREFSFTRRQDSSEDPFEADTRLVIEGDGTAYRRIVSRVTDEVIDIPVTGNALDYERRLLEAKQQMAEADDLARKQDATP